MTSNAAQVLDFIEWPEEPAEFWMETGRQALELPELLTVSEWADKYRHLSDRTTASPGPWRTAMVPYLREVMDAYSDPYVQEITIMGSTQTAKTEFINNCIGFGQDQYPGPALVVLPTDDDVKKMCTERIQPMFEDSPKLAAHLTGKPDDVKVNRIRLKRSTVYFSSSRSPSQLASMPIQSLYLDETDKYEKTTAGGREANPIKLAIERTRTFFNRKIIKTCTPTLEDGYINVEFGKGTRERYYVPCVHCGHYQTLEFTSIQWPEGERDPERVKNERLASYFCPACGEEIADRQKNGMLSRGVWVSEKYEEIDPTTGEITGERPKPCTHRSFTWNALFSPWLTWAEIAAEFLQSKDDPTALQNFTNSWLAKPWKERAEAPELASILSMRCQLPPMVAPRQVHALTCGIDTQKKGFYFSVWAWTTALESWCIHYGYFSGWDQLEALLQTRYAVDGSGETLGIWRAAIDTGGTESEDDPEISRTEEVYNWLRSTRVRLPGGIHGTKGASARHKSGAVVRHTIVDAYPGRNGAKIIGGLILWMVDTAQLKEKFAWRLTKGHESGQTVHLHAETEMEFARHLLAEERRRDPRTRKWKWVKIRKRNDWLDTSLLAHVCADPQWSGGIKSAPPFRAEPRPKLQTTQPPASFRGAKQLW